MHRYLYISLIVLALISIVSCPLLAQEEILIEEIDESTSTIEADRIYIDNNKQEINAIGNVIFFNQELKIEADRLIFDYSNKVITASGEPIIFNYQEKEFQGKSLTLNYEKEIAQISDANIDIQNIRFKGGNIEYLAGQQPNIIINDAYYTTCVMEEAHYHYTAESIKYYPNDKIVGKRVGLVWGETPFLILPRYVINIETDEEGNEQISNAFPVPQLGYDGVRGLYLEIDYPYELSTKNFGNIHYLREDKENNFFEVNHKYRISQNKLIFVDYNDQKYIDNDDFLNEEQYLQLGFDHTYNDNVQYRVYLREYEKTRPVWESIRKTLLNLDLTYTNNQYSIDTVLSYDFRRNLHDQTISSVYNNENLSAETIKEYQNEKLDKQKYVIKQKFADYYWQLKYMKGFETNYLPYGSIHYDLNPNLKFSFGYGYITEGSVKQHKVDYGLNFSKNLKINKNINIDFKQEINQTEYHEIEENLTNYQSQIYFNYNKDINDLLNLKQRIGYSTRYRDGKPLFEIDDIDLNEAIISNTELDLYYPRDKEHWKLGIDLEYSLTDEEFDTQKIAITNEYDCYSYQFNYNFIEKSVGLEFSFKN